MTSEAGGRSATTARVLVPVGMIGGGFPEASVRRARELGADLIAVDGGSTDSGPHYLGAGVAKTARGAVLQDLRLILLAAQDADIPVVVGSCGTSGTDAGVDWLYDMAAEVAANERLSLKVARIYCEQEPGDLVPLLEAGRIRPLAPAGPLTTEALQRCSHVVGVLGAEPIIEALEGGADLVLTGRATDTALIAALPLSRGLAAGPAWHGAKVSECGGLCTTNPRGPGVLVTFDTTGFTIEPLDPEAACTPLTVAAHMLYENRDPFRMREPAGTLDAGPAIYNALDERRVRVEGSLFEPADQYTTKLEGAAPAGFQTSIIVGIRDPDVLARLDEFRDGVLGYLRSRATKVLGLEPGAFDLQLVAYGYDALGPRGSGPTGPSEPGSQAPGGAGPLEPREVGPQEPREVGLVFTATAADQATATELAKLANPVLLHAPLPGVSHLPSYALLGSPAEIERGEIHEFVLCHAVDVNSPSELFRTILSGVGG